MSIYIAVDGGTTTTRVILVKDYKMADTIKVHAGARANMENENLLKNALKDAVQQILSRNNLTESDVSRILASGMITSEFGLLKLDHIFTPAGIPELHKNMHEQIFPEISSVPFVFVRGVKTKADSFECADMMRGEETELMGILNADYGKCVYVLPGSHSKIIETDESGKITDFATMLTGEMIASLSQYTILKDAVDLSTESFDESYLLKGYACAKKDGLNKALFKTRILKNLYKATAEETYSFFIGAVLCDEIECILQAEAQAVVLGGKAQIKNAMAYILQNCSDKKVIVLDEEAVNSSTAMGAIRIYTYEGNNPKE